MILKKIINSIIIIAISYILLKIIKYLLNKIFEITRFDIRYENTLNSVLSSISYYIIFICSVTMILKEFNIVDVTKFGTLVTGASIVGLIAGFASQSILKDIFNGFFILFERQLRVGDFVIINEEIKGTVEEIGLRSTSLRDWDLRRTTIANGYINSIRNYSRTKMRVITHVRVSYYENPKDVLNSLQEVCNILNKKYEKYIIKNINNEYIEKFSIYGVTDIVENSSGAQYTISGVVESNKYFEVLKDSRLQILIVFRENKINIAYPTNINLIYNGYDEYNPKDIYSKQM